MSVIVDKIVPPIIAGLLILMIFKLNAFMMESQVDNRLNNEMQIFSELASTIVQEELRTAMVIVDITGNSIEYIDVNNMVVTIERDNQQLVIRKTDPVTLDQTVTEHSAYLTSLEFVSEPEGLPVSQVRFLRVKLMSESNLEAHIRFGSQEQTSKSFSERQVYLRNVVATSLQL